MKLGVDFGTTRIVVAAADRGNYPLVSFEAPDGQSRDWYPSLVAVSHQGRAFGWDTWALQGDPNWTVIRSIKRLLRTAGPKTELQVGAATFVLHDLTIELLTALRTQLLQRSTLQLRRGEPLEVIIGVPANANSNQRFLTAEAFRAAGFQVLGTVNEPSAASIEYGHLHREKGQFHSMLVYDLGGGTFDASLVKFEEGSHTVVDAAGLSELGGDDFDEILAELALEAAAVPSSKRAAFTPAQWFRLCDECRERKEALNPNTRKIVIDLDRVHEGWGEVSLAVSDYYERCRPLIERTESVVENLLAAHPTESIETLYVTGGGSELPAVARVLKETFGRRVRRSSYMRSATAIGLAISADDRSRYSLKDRFARNFGVWREADAGHNVAFDLLFARGLELPRPGAPPLRVARAYQPAHNIGHFRYVECTRMAADGLPSGDLTMWDDIRFPFHPSLAHHPDLASVPIQPARQPQSDAPQWIDEEYTCDATGAVKVSIGNRSTGFKMAYSLGRWSGKAARVSAPSAPKPERSWRHRENR